MSTLAVDDLHKGPAAGPAAELGRHVVPSVRR